MRNWRFTTDDVLDVTAYLTGLIGLRSGYGHSHPFHSPVPLTFYLPWIALFGGLALAAYVARRAYEARERLFRLDSFHCLNCGYDLITTPYRCPECGEAHRQALRAKDAEFPDPRVCFGGVAALAIVAAFMVS
jgi:hypothetical protein